MGICYSKPYVPLFAVLLFVIKCLLITLLHGLRSAVTGGYKITFLITNKYSYIHNLMKASELKEIITT